MVALKYRESEREKKEINGEIALEIKTICCTQNLPRKRNITLILHEKTLMGELEDDYQPSATPDHILNGVSN